MLTTTTGLTYAGVRVVAKLLCCCLLVFGFSGSFIVFCGTPRLSLNLSRENETTAKTKATAKKCEMRPDNIILVMIKGLGCTGASVIAKILNFGCRFRFRLASGLLWFALFPN